MLATFIILFAWGGYGIMAYLFLHVIDCGMKNVKLNTSYIIRLVAVSIILMVLMSACAASAGRVKYVTVDDSTRYNRPFSQSSGTGSFYPRNDWILHNRERIAEVSDET